MKKYIYVVLFIATILVSEKAFATSFAAESSIPSTNSWYCTECRHHVPYPMKICPFCKTPRYPDNR